MQIYAVFLPRGLAPSRAADKAVLVRQGFGWGAFLLTPIWALRHGLWLALVLWMSWLFLISFIALVGHLAPDASLALYELGALAFGLEADRFRQASLSRSGYLLHGLALGESIVGAETLYFNRRIDLTLAPAVARPVIIAGQAAPQPAADGGNDLLGLFPPRESKF